MRQVHNIPIVEIMPDRDRILHAQGIYPGHRVKREISRAADRALRLFSELACPVSIVSEISREDFDPVYEGMGLNEDVSPIADVCRQAGHLMLFAATVGAEISGKIAHLFSVGDFVLGNALDVAASEGTDRISHWLEEFFEATVSEEYPPDSDLVVFAYSPGYCGWHISAQKALFDTLRPSEIGITLRDSFLMDPLKSISGVLAAGPKDIHRIDADYPFCIECEGQPCRARLKAIENRSPRQSGERKP